MWNDLTTDEMLENFTLDTEGKNFFVIVKKAELGIDIDVPVGLIDQDETKYPGGFFEYIKTKYGYAFSVDTFGLPLVSVQSAPCQTVCRNTFPFPSDRLCSGYRQPRLCVQR